MSALTKLFVTLRESKRGQTMTEYVLIIAAVGVAGYASYQGLAGGINGLINSVKTTLTGA